MFIIRSASIDTKNISKLKAKSNAIVESGKTYKDPVNSLSDNGDVFKINNDMSNGLQMMNYSWRISEHFAIFHPQKCSHKLDKIRNFTPYQKHHTP